MSADIVPLRPTAKPPTKAKPSTTGGYFPKTILRHMVEIYGGEQVQIWIGEALADMER